MTDMQSGMKKGRALPAELPGHWDTLEGCQMATDYLGKQRSDLCKGEVSDLLLANAVFMASRTDLDLIVWQTAAKERIRWLSAQLAAARADISQIHDEATDSIGRKMTTEQRRDALQRIASACVASKKRIAQPGATP